MVFSSPVFLWQFLPVVLALYFVLGPRLRNLVLLVASLYFYAWGEQEVVLVMIASILANYAFGLAIERSRRAGGSGKGVVALGIVFNLALLVAFKYAKWIWREVSSLLLATGMRDEALAAVEIDLPIGISFFTFQAMSYVVDVYRREASVQRNPIHFGVYIALFPQLIAGPIVRYRDVAEQIVSRVVSSDGFAWGVRRFVIGLGKKMLVANTVAKAADEIFALPASDLNAPVAWLGILCYTVQIYFDFSGYSDMAIGLGRMLGFRFLENFNFPYISRSITEFWRRWHISLSSWYRDYLYIPLGGNRRGAGRTYFNLILVFFLCGLWHGASWSFVVWGLFHGAFLVLERLGLGAAVHRAPRFLQHAYVLLVVIVGWVFFRATTLGAGLDYLEAMLGLGAGSAYSVGYYLNPVLGLALAAGVIGSMPWFPSITAWCDERAKRGGVLPELVAWSGVLGLVLVFLLSAMELAAGTYNPFIYYRF